MTEAPTPSPVAEPNPLANAITSFIGSANVQKTLGVLLAGSSALTAAVGSSKGIGLKVAGMTVGSVFTVAVHYIDYLRAKLGR